MQNNKKIHLMSLAFTLCIGLLYLFLFNKAYILLTIESPETQQLQLFWKSDGSEYSEQNSKTVQIRNNQWRYLIYFDSLTKVDKLRIDPARKKDARVRIVSVTVGQMGLRSFELYENKLDNIKILQNASKVKLRDNTVLFRSYSDDPAVEIDLPKTQFNRWFKLLEYMMLSYIVFWLAYLLMIGRRETYDES